MKTHNLFKFAVILLAVAGMLFSGCRKDDDDQTDTSGLSQTKRDQMMLAAAEDMATNDANKILGGSGSKAMLWVPCNATLDSSFVIADTITYIVSYNGLNCEGTYNRVGTVEIHKAVNTHWVDAGAVVYVKYINFKITRVTDQRWVIVNGTKRYTNESGGLVALLGNPYTSIVRSVSGTLSATFDDNSTRNWSISRRKTWTGVSGSLRMSVEGLGSADGYTNLESWGVNRQGNNYYNSVTTPVVFKESCSWDPCSGGGIVSIPASDITATVSYGYDSNGNVVDPNGTSCPTHYKVDWTKGNNSGTFLLAL